MTQGARAGTQAVVVHVATARKPLQGSTVSHHRVAVVAGRRIGNAVQRNRAKRRLRAIAQDLFATPPSTHPLGLPDPLDIVLVAKPDISATEYVKLSQDVYSAFNRACKRMKA